MHAWLVDDDGFFRSTTEDALRAHGFEVTSFAEASECVVALSGEAPMPEVIVTDLYMPVVDGTRLVSMVRAHPRGESSAIVVVSALADETTLEEAVHLGADHALRKPTDPLELVVACHAACSKRSPSLPDLARTDVGVLFSDVRGFTQFSTGHDPETAVEVVSALTGLFVEAVEAAGGWVDKVLGDGLIALFGAPRPHPAPVLAAVVAARSITRATASFFEESVLLAGRGPLLGVGSGITFGPVVAGRMGPEGRKSYTALGDPMNLAARLQSLAAAGEILLGPAAAATLNGRLPLGQTRTEQIRGVGELPIHVVPVEAS